MPHMPRHPARLVLIALLVLSPALATAQPPRASSTTSATHSETTFPLFAHLRSLFSVLWKNGSILEPDGRPGPFTTTGDTGSILDPNGRH